METRVNRVEHRKADRFAPARDMWNEVMVNCRDNYTAGPVVTSDEQLLTFRGKCRFRMFIPSKPAKYGLKIFMVCDSESSYCLNASPYLGKDELTVREVPKGGCKMQH